VGKPRRALALFAVLLVGAHGASAAGAGLSVQQCIAANESAQDHRTTGKLRRARALLASCESTSCPSAIRQDCARRLDDVDRAMPTIVFSVRDDQGNDVSAVTVAMDGEVLTDRLDGRALAVDLGEHTFRFSSAAGAVTTKTLVVREGEKDRRELIPLSAAGAEGGDQAPRDPRHRRAWQRTAGIAMGAAGAGTSTVAAILGVAAKVTYDHAKSQCPEGVSSPVGCGQSAHDESANARAEATASTALFVIGGAFLGAGAALYFTAPAATRPTPLPPEVSRLTWSVLCGPRAAGLGVRGTW
jgi:hypothetical protein